MMTSPHNNLSKISEESLQPHVRLFLSVDVVGSTAYKQRWISAEVNESWIVFFRSFFDEFHVSFCSEIAEVSKIRVLSKTGCPVPWKLLGDEILYAIKIDKGHEVFLYTEAFRKAVMNHRDKIEQSGKPVSLKATAWLAGFPVGNSVMSTPMGEDFIGPLVDIGFRLSKFSSRERMVLSVDLAWYLTKGDSGPRSLFLDGLQSLKGVLGDKPYPIIWWSMDEALSSGMKNVGLVNYVDTSKLHEYCDLFIARAPKPLIRPFFLGDNDSLPDHYQTDLDRVRQLWNGVPNDPQGSYDKNASVLTPMEDIALAESNRSFVALIDKAVIEKTSDL
ncbi:MAG: hypothetical protein HQL75_13805 [Magnetococcales bacterium]|nr:hypothetical protein [Magnetococcales bacterium]